MPPSPWEEDCLVHNDLCPDHVLVDAVSGDIVAVLDFGDAAWGDPVLDFAVLPGWLGVEGTAAALAAYELPLDPSFEERLAFLSRVLTLAWLQEAHEMEGNTAMLRAWVLRAFSCFPGGARDGR